MKDTLLSYFSIQASALSTERILLNFLVAAVLGLVIYLAYRLSHSGPVYSARFNVSLWMLTLITTLVMAVIGNNVALSLGMVGALSIVRFRTAIKDPRDTAYIFWCIAVGICCGVSEYLIAALGSALLFLFLLLFGKIHNNDRYLLIVHGQNEGTQQVERRVEDVFAGKAVLRVKNVTQDGAELIFELSEAMLRKSGTFGSITGELSELTGVSSVSLVCQNDEISR